MELREQIARQIFAICDRVFAQEMFAENAVGEILEIPAIREALEEKRINAMSPSQFGEKLLAPDMSNYGNPRKQDRRYKKPD